MKERIREGGREGVSEGRKGGNEGREGENERVTIFSPLPPPLLLPIIPITVWIWKGQGRLKEGKGRDGKGRGREGRGREVKETTHMLSVIAFSVPPMRAPLLPLPPCQPLTSPAAATEPYLTAALLGEAGEVEKGGVRGRG